MKIFLVLMAGLFSLLLVSSMATATQLNFDDLSDYPESGNYWGQIDDGYGGLDWSGLYYLYTQGYADSDSVYNQYYIGTVSGSFCAYNYLNTVSITCDDSFTFNGAYFTAGWSDTLTITVAGISGDEVSYSENIVVTGDNATWVQFDWSGIDKLTFTVDGGKQFVIDDLEYNEPVSTVPEPATFFLMGLGLLYAAGMRREKIS